MCSIGCQICKLYFICNIISSELASVVESSYCNKIILKCELGKLKIIKTAYNMDCEAYKKSTLNLISVIISVIMKKRSSVN